MTEREKMWAYVTEGRYDRARWLVWSDWLEEQGFDDEATEARRWAALTPQIQQAEDHLRDLAARAGEHCEKNYGAVSAAYREAHNRWWERFRQYRGEGEDHTTALREARARWGKIPSPEDYPLPPGEAEVWRPVTYEDLLKAGCDYVDSGGDEFWVQHGSERLRDLMDDTETRRYWESWELVTGRGRLPPDAPGGKETYTTHPFSCSC